MKKILFICVENSARSQMAEAFFNQISKKARAQSAGAKPAQAVNPLAVQVMKEIGVDISKGKPKMLKSEAISSAKRIITMGCMDNTFCPNTSIPTEDWGIENPAGKSIKKFREVRDLLKEKVVKLANELENLT